MEQEQEVQDRGTTVLGSALPIDRQQLGWVLLGTGLAGSLFLLLRRNRLLLEWLLPLGLTGGGLAMLLRARQETIAQAEERIAAELEALDPIARAQVLKRVATEELGLKRGDKPEPAPE